MPRQPARIPGAEKVQVSLVLIDVVVRDRKDNPVAGLTRDDFELLVDRLPAPASDIESFEEVCPTAQPPQTATLQASAPHPSASIAGPISAEPRHIVVYLDFSQLSLDGRRQALKAARDHLIARVGANDRVMLLAYKKSLRLVEDFTSDAGLLASRLNEMLDDKSTLDNEVLEEGQNMYAVSLKSCETSSSCTARRSLATTYATQEEMRARRSLHAIESLMPALAGIKGRKALVLFTDVLREEPGVEYVALANATPKQAGIDLDPDMLRLTQEANAAGVSIYTVHASGLDDRATSSLQDIRPITSGAAPSVPQAEVKSGIAASGENAALAYEAARTGLDSALALQTTFATETGGHALQRSNDVGAIFDTAQQDLSCYYLIGYRYQGHGDNARHSILVKLKPDRGDDSRRGLTLRYRPYYTDSSPEDRRARLIRSALDAPDLFRRLPITTEAFALAPEETKRRVLFKTTVPLGSLSMIPSGDDALAGHAAVTGEVRGSEDSASPVCAFEHELPLKVPRGPDAVTRLVFETGCLLAPGSYELALAVLDPTTMDIAARHSTLSVQPISRDRQTFVSDVSLWARDAGALVVSVGAEAIGLKSSSSEKAFVPHSERRLAKGQEALMSFLLCPVAGSRGTPESPILVRRRLLGEGDAEVASFRDLTITEPPDEETGCYQIFNTIPAKTLGSGVYRFTIQLSGSSIGAPVSREADLLVD